MRGLENFACCLPTLLADEAEVYLHPAAYALCLNGGDTQGTNKA